MHVQTSVARRGSQRSRVDGELVSKSVQGEEFCSTSGLIERVAGPVHEFWRNGPTSAVKRAIRLKRYIEHRCERSLRMAGG